MDKEKIVLPIGGVPMKLTRELPTYHKRIAGYRENKNTYDGQMVHMCFLNENFASEIIRKHSEFEEYDEMYRRMVFFNPTEGQVEQEEKKRIEQVFNWYVYHQNQNVYINHQTIDSRNQFAIVERIVQSNLSYLQRFYPKTHQYLTQMPDSSVFHEFNQNIIQYKNQLLEQFYREFHGIHESVQPFVLNSMIERKEKAKKLAAQVERAYTPMSEKVRENQIEEGDYAERGQNAVLTYRRMESTNVWKEEQLSGQKEMPSFQKNFAERQVAEVEKKLIKSLTRKEMEDKKLTERLERKETAEKQLTEELERKETEDKKLTERLVRSKIEELQSEKEKNSKEWLKKAGSLETQDYPVKKQEVLGESGKAELEQGKTGQRARELGEELKSKYGEIQQGREAEKLAVQVERAYVPMTEKVRENQVEERDYAEAGQNEILTYRRMESADFQKEEQLLEQKELPSYQKNFVEKQVAEVEKKLTESLTRKEMEEQSLTQMLEKKETAEKYLTEKLERKEKTEKNLTEPLARKEAEERNLTETLARKEAEERNLTETLAGKEATEKNLTETFVRREIAGLQSEKENSKEEWREKAGSLEPQDYSVKKQEVLGENGKAELEQGKAGQRARELGEELKSKYGEIRQGREAEKLAVQVERAYVPMTEKVRENQIEEGDYAEAGQNEVLTYRRMESANVQKEEQLPGQKELPSFQKNFVEKHVAEVEQKLIESLTRKEMEEQSLTEMLEKKEAVGQNLTEKLERKETEEKNLTETLARKETEEKNLTETLARKEATEKNLIETLARKEATEQNLTETFVRREIAGLQREKESSAKESAKKEGSWEPQDYPVKKQEVLGESGKAELEQGKAGQRARELGEELKSKYGKIQQGYEAEKLAVQVERAYVPMTEKVRENQVEERDYAEAGQNEVLTYRRMESADFQKEEQLSGQKELPSFQKNFVEKQVAEVGKKLTESLTRKETEERKLAESLVRKETEEKNLTEMLARKETEEKNLTEMLARKEIEEKNLTETLARKEATEKNLIETLARKEATEQNLTETFVRREIAGLQREKESSAKEWREKAGSLEPQAYSVKKQEVLGESGKAELEQGKAGQRARELGEELKSKYGKIQQGHEAEKLAVQVERAYVPMSEKVHENQIEEGDYAEAGQNEILTYRRMESADFQKEEQLPGQKELPSFPKNFVEGKVAEVEKKLTESLTRKEMAEKNLTQMFEKKETAEKHLIKELERKETEEKNLTETLARKEAESKNLTEAFTRKDATEKKLIEMLAGEEAESKNLTEMLAGKEETEKNLIEELERKETAEKNRTETLVRREIAGLQREKENRSKEWMEKAGSWEPQDYPVKKQELSGENKKAELERGKAGQRARELGEELKSKYGKIQQGREAEKLAVQVERAYVPMTEKVRENQVEEGDYAEAGPSAVLTYRRMESADFQKEEQLSGQKELPSFQKNFVEKQVAEVGKKLTESLARKETEEKTLTETLARKEAEEKHLTETLVRKEAAGLQSEKENRSKEWKEKAGSWESQDYSVKKQAVLEANGKANLEQGKAGLRARELGEELKSKYEKIEKGRKAEKLARHVARTYEPMTEKVSGNQIGEGDYKKADQNAVLTYRIDGESKSRQEKPEKQTVQSEKKSIQSLNQIKGNKESKRRPGGQKVHRAKSKKRRGSETDQNAVLTYRIGEIMSLQMKNLFHKPMSEKAVENQVREADYTETGRSAVLTYRTGGESNPKPEAQLSVQRVVVERQIAESEKKITQSLELAKENIEQNVKEARSREEKGRLDPERKEWAKLEKGQVGTKARKLGENLWTRYTEIEHVKEVEKLASKVVSSYVRTEDGKNAVLTFRMGKNPQIMKELVTKEMEEQKVQRARETGRIERVQLEKGQTGTKAKELGEMVQKKYEELKNETSDGKPEQNNFEKKQPVFIFRNIMYQQREGDDNFWEEIGAEIRLAQNNLTEPGLSNSSDIFAKYNRYNEQHSNRAGRGRTSSKSQILEGLKEFMQQIQSRLYEKDNQILLEQKNQEILFEQIEQQNHILREMIEQQMDLKQQMEELRDNKRSWKEDNREVYRKMELEQKRYGLDV